MLIFPITQHGYWISTNIGLEPGSAVQCSGQYAVMVTIRHRLTAIKLDCIYILVCFPLSALRWILPWIQVKRKNLLALAYWLDFVIQIRVRPAALANHGARFYCFGQLTQSVYWACLLCYVGNIIDQTRTVTQYVINFTSNAVFVQIYNLNSAVQWTSNGTRLKGP